MTFREKPFTPRRNGAKLVNAMSVDVEDYFQVQALSGRVRLEDWDGLPHRVERNTDAVLRLFSDAGIKATFFTLGWVAERYPALIRRIVEQGHELASHGWNHRRVDGQTPEQFSADIRKTKAVLEDAGGTAVIGYRAATFSISHRTPWAFEVLADAGYRYSSSVFPVRHDYYGMPDAPRFAFHPLEGRAFDEYPMTTTRVGGRNLPCSGGGYFRLLPYPLLSWAMNRVNHDDQRPVIFYFHPWEIDPDQPRFDNLPFKSRVRHYTNLGRMEGKLRQLTQDFAWDRIDRVMLPPAA